MKISKATIAVFILVLLIAGAAIYWKSTGSVVQNNTATEAEAKWIGAHSVVYVQAGCIHCKDQEDLFGNNWKYINSIDCISSQANTQACITANITATPTWVINGQQYVGFQTLSNLDNLTGYKA